jgi:[acyl-carrier-protein] S-malonyltransferase
VDKIDSLKEQIAFVFPGQGSQYVGMGKDLYENFSAALHIFNRADEVLGFPLSTLCFEGPQEALDDTANTQPAIFTVSIACLESLKEYCQDVLGKTIAPVMVAGHSLGEFTALVAAGVLSFEDALQLVSERARLMKESSTQQPGGMAAIIGLDRDTLQQVCLEAQSHGIVTLANDNSPGQSVLSGEQAALHVAMKLAKERGAKVVQQLAITVASHSPLMQQAAQNFRETVQNFTFHPPEIPLLSNVTAQSITGVDELRQELADQLTLPVQWTRSIQTAVSEGIETFVELGPGQVLSRLIRRIAANSQSISLSDVEIVKLRNATPLPHLTATPSASPPDATPEPTVT